MTKGIDVEIGKWIRAQWDRVLAWVCVVAGAVVLIVGWVGVSRYAYPADQLPYIISGGIGGLFLLGLGAMLWLSADLRDEWRKLDEIDRRNASFYDSQPPGSTGLRSTDDRPSFAAPATVGATPEPAIACLADDDTRESVVVGRSGAALSLAATESPAPTSSSRRRSGTAVKADAPASAARKSNGRRTPKQGLAQP